MNIEDARKMALDLMFQHGLTSYTKDWNFTFDDAVRRFGLCSYWRRTISLSRRLVERNDEAEVRNTILHEIAHALAGSKAKHGPEWKRKAAEIGARPERCYDMAEVNTPDAPYQAICNQCSSAYKRFRVARRTLACSKCCREFNGGRFDARYKLTFVRVSGGAIVQETI